MERFSDNGRMGANTRVSRCIPALIRHLLSLIHGQPLGCRQGDWCVQISEVISNRLNNTEYLTHLIVLMTIHICTHLCEHTYHCFSFCLNRSRCLEVGRLTWFCQRRDFNTNTGRPKVRSHKLTCSRMIVTTLQKVTPVLHNRTSYTCCLLSQRETKKEKLSGDSTRCSRAFEYR